MADAEAPPLKSSGLYISGLQDRPETGAFDVYINQGMGASATFYKHLFKHMLHPSIGPIWEDQDIKAQKFKIGSFLYPPFNI